MSKRAPWLDVEFPRIEGYGGFVTEFGGAIFNEGIYRIHDAQTGPRARSLIIETFPEFRARVFPFAYDWLGRQFAVDSGRVAAGEPQVLLLEPGTGEALEIPVSFLAFHDEEITEHADAARATVHGMVDREP